MSTVLSYVFFTVYMYAGVAISLPHIGRDVVAPDVVPETDVYPARGVLVPFVPLGTCGSKV